MNNNNYHLQDTVSEEDLHNKIGSSIHPAVE